MKMKNEWKMNENEYESRHMAICSSIFARL